MATLFERAAIVGVGLIGGSLALAARAAGLIGEVVGVGRSEENLAVARRRGIADRTTTDLAQVGRVDLVVLAVPVASVGPTGRALAPVLDPATVVSDVASVKASIVAALEPLLPRFVGAHPIAGTERSGAAAAEIDLFRGSRCVVTPTPRTDRAALEKVAALWRGVGATVEEMDPRRHDSSLAWTSHVVHALAYTLARAIGERDAGLFELAGPSLRDVTRVAASSPELWREILTANADAVSAALREYAGELNELRAAIEERDGGAVLELLRAGRAARLRLEGKKP